MKEAKKVLNELLEDFKEEVELSKKLELENQKQGYYLLAQKYMLKKENYKSVCNTIQILLNRLK